MKNLLLMMSLTLSTIAYAGPFAYQCTEFGTGPDNGYRVAVSQTKTQATVVNVVNGHSSTVSTLNCSKVYRRPSYPDDGIATVLSCVEPQIRDDGYEFEINQGGLAGRATGTLSKITLSGAELVAEMSCQVVDPQ